MNGENKPKYEDSDCVGGVIMRNALQRLGFYAELAERDSTLLTNANQDELLTLFPDEMEEGFDSGEHYSKFDPVGADFADYTDTWVHPHYPEEVAPNKIAYWLGQGERVYVKINQPPAYPDKPVVCFYSKGAYPEFSNFYPAEFATQTYQGGEIVEEKRYPSAEHYFQMMKALEFDPNGEVMQKMGNHLSCAEIKALGRKVQNFDAKVWNIRRLFHMHDAVCLKFCQNKPLLELLLSTGDAILAEASPRDTFWGIGYSASNPKAQNPAEWRGRNFLGNILMRLRDNSK